MLVPDKNCIVGNGEAVVGFPIAFSNYRGVTLRIVYLMLVFSHFASGCPAGKVKPAGERPRLISSALSDEFVAARSPLKVSASFVDAEGDFIVDVQVSWRRVGTQGWAQKRMDFVLGSTSGEFEATIYPTGEGTYEVEFRAADAASLEKPIFGKSKWGGRKTFRSWIPARNHPAVLHSSEVAESVAGKKRIVARFQDADSEDVVVDVQGRWRKVGAERWQLGTLEWVRPTSNPTVFELHRFLDPGVYEFEVRASDAPLDGVGKFRKSRTGWLSMGEKITIASHKPK